MPLLDIIWFSVIFLIIPVIILSIRIKWLERKNDWTSKRNSNKKVWIPNPS
jgi:hypothetical protein